MSLSPLSVSHYSSLILDSASDKNGHSSNGIKFASHVLVVFHHFSSQKVNSPHSSSLWSVFPPSRWPVWPWGRLIAHPLGAVQRIWSPGLASAICVCWRCNERKPPAGLSLQSSAPVLVLVHEHWTAVIWQELFSTELCLSSCLCNLVENQAK